MTDHEKQRERRKKQRNDEMKCTVELKGTWARAVGIVGGGPAFVQVGPAYRYSGGAEVLKE